MTIYIDDTLAMAETENLLKDHITAVVYLLENIGFVANHPKSELTPTQEPPTVRVDYPRQRYKDCQVSEGAMKLLLASWRQKFSKTYNSLFRKWVSWCGERDCDPFHAL